MVYYTIELGEESRQVRRSDLPPLPSLTLTGSFLGPRQAPLINVSVLLPSPKLVARCRFNTA